MATSCNDNDTRCTFSLPCPPLFSQGLHACYINHRRPHVYKISEALLISSLKMKGSDVITASSVVLASSSASFYPIGGFLHFFFEVSFEWSWRQVLELPLHQGWAETTQNSRLEWVKAGCQLRRRLRMMTEQLVWHTRVCPSPLWRTSVNVFAWLHFDWLKIF